MAKDANNPLASIRAISTHNAYTSSIYGVGGTMNTTWIRYAQPIGRFLIRASLPINSLSTDNYAKSGLGDMNIFATYIVTRPTARNQFGIGPILTFPTATSSKLGAGKWQAGLAVVAYLPMSNALQMGLLATWQHSFAGDSDRPTVNISTIQPFFIWQLGRGAYLRSTATKVLDFAQDTYYSPLGLGFGQVLPVNKMVFNFFIEPQFTVWHSGKPVPKVQLWVGINTQF